MAIVISPKIKKKLQEKHSVSEEEVHECFANREGRLLMDTREEHRSDPPTLWFIAETHMGRKLKIVFIQKGEDIYLRTAYEANETEIRIYEKYGLKGGER
ncbi:MAG: ADP-ribosyl-(dinitrogen reductase) hydrolase [Gammaproteobacteria bacterium]|nr:MAG: ADP-ribosyl-(dinitrogen reductase) hydrolase [Gammaproteobacteria bacterium]